VTDVVDVLRTQHDQMRRLCGDVQRAAGADKKRLFVELDRACTSSRNACTS
jgi:hypothetical protein